MNLQPYEPMDPTMGPTASELAGIRPGTFIRLSVWTAVHAFGRWRPADSATMAPMPAALKPACLVARSEAMPWCSGNRMFLRSYETQIPAADPNPTHYQTRPVPAVNQPKKGKTNANEL